MQTTPKAFREQVYSHMLETRGPKYTWFLRALQTFKYASVDPMRGAFLEDYYALMRHVDDIVDGDAPLPPTHNSKEEFVSQKIQFARDPQYPSDTIDDMILHCLDLGKKFGQDFTQETDDILSSMLFDAKRIGKRTLFEGDVLDQHFYRLDIRGTIRAA